MAINVRTVFQWLNNDSTADLNQKFATVFHKGITSGATISTVPSELSVVVSPYEAMTEAGLLLVSDLDYKFTNIPLNQMTVFTIYGKWLQGDAPTVEYRVYEINDWNGLTNKSDHVVFAAVTLGNANTEVLIANISYDLRDVFDKLGRSSFRGSLTTAVNLPASNNRENDFYAVGGGGGLVEIYAWNGNVWLNITNTLALQNEVTNHRNNAFINEKHLTDLEKDAVLGTTGIPNSTNRFVTSADPRLPTQNENDALVGSDGSVSSTNTYITQEYALAETNYLIYPLAPGTLSLLSIAGKFIGNGGIGSANTYFSLMDIGNDRGYINSVGLFPKIVDIWKNSLLTIKLDPSVDADGNGFYDGDLYITVDNVIDTGVRLAYSQKKTLKSISRGFAIKKGSESDFVPGEAMQYIQDIKGRDYIDLIPTDEKNINLRSDLDDLVSYLGSNQKISIVAGKEDFEYFKTNAKLAPHFIENENVPFIYNYQNNALIGFTYNSGIISYTGSPNLTSVVSGNLFRDGLGNFFKITNKTLTSVTIVDIATNLTPISSPNTSVSTSMDGSIVVNNNPRNVLANELKAYAHEIIKFDTLLEIEELSIPEGRQAFGIVQENERINPNIVFYGSWENYTDPDTNEMYIRNTNGIGDIQVTGFLSEVYLLCKPKPASPVLGVSLNGEQISSTIDISSGGLINSVVSSLDGHRFTRVLIKNSLTSSSLNTINMRIQAATADALIVYGIELVSFPSVNATVSNELLMEAGIGFKSSKFIKKSANEVVVIPAINKYGVNYQVTLDKDINGNAIYNTINTPTPEIDYYPSYVTSSVFVGANCTVTDPNAKIFKVNDIIQLIGAVRVDTRKINTIVGTAYTFDSAPLGEAKQFRLLCSLGDDTPFESYNSYAAKYNLINDFVNGSKTDFSIANSGNLANRYVVHKDGQTIIGAKNANVSEDFLTVSIASTGSLDIGVFGPKMALEFNNTSAVTIQVTIDGSNPYSMVIPAGKVRKTIYSKGRNSFHEVHITSAAGFAITDIVLYTIERGNYSDATLLATIDNVSPYYQSLAKDENAYRQSSGKIFYDAYHHGTFLNGAGAGWALLDIPKFLGRCFSTSGNGDSFKFSFTGEAFEIYGLGNLTAGKAKVQIDGVYWNAVVGATVIGSADQYMDLYSVNYDAKIFAVTGLSYATHTVTITLDNPSSGLAVGIFGYAVLSSGGRLRNTYNNISQVYTPVWDSRDFTSSAISFGNTSTASTKANTGTSFTTNQTAHGFSVLNPIYHDGTIWRKAQANTNTTLATYVVTKASTDSFTATKFGLVKLIGHGLTAGEFYYTSSSLAGGLSNVEPMFGFSNPVLYVEDSVKVHIMCHRPTAIGDGSVSDSEVSAIVAFPSNAEPDGFLYCDGRSVSRSIYSALYNKVGNRYGQGDGSTTFNLPDMRGWFMRGGVEVTTKTFLPAAVNTGTSTIQVAVHQFRRSGFKVRLSTTTTLPAPLTINTDYYIVYVDDDNFKVATSAANAIAGTFITLTTQGTGTHTVQQWASPDESGRYALGAGGGGSFGGAQDDLFESHTHIQDAHSHALSPSVFTNSGSSNPWTGGSGMGLLSATGNTTATNQYTGGNETRAQNVTVGFFIRYASKGAIKGQIIPAGLMFSFGGPSGNVPNGYLMCDGSSLLRADYPDLFNSIGTSWGAANITHFNLPDSRGLFLRGVDGAAGRDPDKATRTAIATGGNTGNNVGSLQSDAYQYHTHYLESWAGFNGDGSANPNNQGYGSAGPYGNSISTKTSDGSYSTETRGKNAYVNYVIKY